MVNILRQRSLVEIFSCHLLATYVKEGFCKRDLNDQDILSELDQVEGNTQGKKLNNIRLKTIFYKLIIL
jgi:hypothetical protein